MNSRTSAAAAFLILLASIQGGAFSMAPTPAFELQDTASYAAQEIDGKSFLAGLIKTAAGFNDYTYQSLIVTSVKGKRVEKAGDFFFKKPNLVRVEDQSPAYHLGSVVVRQPDGRIRAAGGPGLQFLKMTLSENSRFFQLPNGYNVIKSDLTSLLQGINRAVKDGSTVRVTKAPVPVSNLGQSVYVVDVTADGVRPEQLTDRIFISTETNVPVDWELFRNGSLVSVTSVRNFRSNVGLDDSLFKI